MESGYGKRICKADMQTRDMQSFDMAKKSPGNLFDYRGRFGADLGLVPLIVPDPPLHDDPLL